MDDPPPPKRRRKAYSKKKRQAILDRTEGRCYSCGLKMSFEDDWWVEHILPFSREGSDEVVNLLPSCRLCNFVRGNSDPIEVRRMLNIGYALYPEVRKQTPIGKLVSEFLERREAKLSKRRKHAVLAMNEATQNTIRAERLIDGLEKAEQRLG